ncbi:MAG: SDR family NAD(P)-dependent oxidoreductase [Treponema sp.]|nr:SDR family NAD(P)-dependent oxidoreductase [Treponema sp.]
MKPEALIAAEIRGAIINKTGKPWVVSYETAVQDSMAVHNSAAAQDSATVPDSAVLRVKPENVNDTRIKILEAVKNYGPQKIPLKIEIDCGWDTAKDKTYSYLCAPDFDSIEKIRAGTITEPWAVDIITADAACADTQTAAARTAAAQTTAGRQGAADFGTSRSLVVKNRVAVVTGGAQGFGEEITRGLVSAGAIVFIADLNYAGAAKLAQTLNRDAGRIIAFPAEVNVADEASVEKMTENIALKTGGLDLCVSNAGVLRASSILEQDITSFKFVTDINYTAFAIVTKHCGLLMSRQNLNAPLWTTDIIQINSKSGLDGSNKNGSYAGSKFGGIGLVQSFAKELVDYRIKVNAVCPGNFFDGPLWADPEKGLFVQYLKTGKVPGAKNIAEVKAFYESKVPMGRGCTGPDVIRAVLYLVEQVYETGQALPVTGGQVMLS